MHWNSPRLIDISITFHLSNPLIYVQPENGKNFAVVFASIGDCKAYHWEPSGRVSEITRGNRGNHDMKDPGGRLGPHSNDGSPDLRNFSLYCQYCNEGDFITFVSDGVHDNLGSLYVVNPPN